MGTGGAVVAVLAGKYAELRPHLDERGWRLYLGSEARAYAAGEGCGLAAAVAVVAEAAGVSRATVMAGAGELAEGGRSRCRDGRGGRARAAGSWRRGIGVRGGAAGPAGGLHAGRPDGGGDLDDAVAAGDRAADGRAGASVREGCAGADDARRRLQPAGELPGHRGQAASGPGRPVPAHQRHDRPRSGPPGTRWSAWMPRRRSSSARTGRAGRSWRRKGDPVRVRGPRLPPMRSWGRNHPVRGLRHHRGTPGSVSVGTELRHRPRFAVERAAPVVAGAGRGRRYPPQYGGCWSPATPGAPTATGAGSGKTSWRGWPRRPAWRSPCVISRPAPNAVACQLQTIVSRGSQPRA